MVIKKLKQFKNRMAPSSQQPPGNGATTIEQPLSPQIDANVNALRAILDRCCDLVFRELSINGSEPVRACLVFFHNLVDIDSLEDRVIRTLQISITMAPPGERMVKANAFDLVQKHLLNIANFETTDQLDQIVTRILTGSTAFLIDGSNQAVLLSTQGWKDRNIDEPSTEPVVRGPRDGFIENADTNLALIRRRLKTPRLKTEKMEIGRLTRTKVIITYLDGLANTSIVDEVRRRLNRIDIDGILESGYIEELIEDQPYSPFPQLNETERPDKAAAQLLEGYVLIIVDTTPMVLIAPATFPVFLQSTEDYYNRFAYATFIRLLRFLSLNVSLLLPSFYIAIITFHQEMLPTPLLISLAAQRTGVPLPAFAETLFMEITFEVLREAGIRLPRAIGQTVSIVGALVIGTAAVEAGLVSAGVVMIVSFTAISSFIIPTISGSYAIRLLRFPIIILAATFGLLGIMVALMAILFHLCSLRSFGVPYLSPLAPLVPSELKDMFVRAPWWAMLRRPQLVAHHNLQRQQAGQKPRIPAKQTRTKASRSKKEG